MASVLCVCTGHTHAPLSATEELSWWSFEVQVQMRLSVVFWMRNETWIVFLKARLAVMISLIMQL